MPDTTGEVEVPLDTGQQNKGRVESTDVLGTKVICDGLLCSILSAMSNAANKEEFISVIDRECEEAEILLSRRKLFSHYCDVQCDKQKKAVLDITRGSKRKNIEDIVDQMIKVDQTEKSQLFYMPWDYTIKPFMSDTEKRAELIEKELSTEIDCKLDSLKNEMNVKNQAIMELIHNKFAQVSQLLSQGPAPQQGQHTPYQQVPPSYAGVVASRAPGHVGQPGDRGRGGHGCEGGQTVPTFNIVPPTPTYQGGGHCARGRANQGDDHINRSRSNSNKRRRMDEGIREESEKVVKDRSQSQSTNKQKKFVVGTSNQAGRKMRSPPADIFVYGVHPDTTPEDIVQDLAFSEIIIKTEDITVKSKEEAYLKSYKISVKAEDLQKALDPSVWPLRVKVREFIHYSRKTSANLRNGGQENRFGGARHGGAAGGGHQQGHQVGEQRGQHSQLLAPNRYALPGDGVPGGHLQTV